MIRTFLPVSYPHLDVYKRQDYKGEVIRHDVKKYVADTDYVVQVIERHVEKAKNNLKGSPIIIAGGYGVGSKENFNLLFDLAKVLNAEVGASLSLIHIYANRKQNKMNSFIFLCQSAIYICFSIKNNK